MNYTIDPLWIYLWNIDPAYAIGLALLLGGFLGMICTLLCNFLLTLKKQEGDI